MMRYLRWWLILSLLAFIPAGCSQQAEEKAEKAVEDTKEVVGDAAITTAVKTKLAADETVEAADIDVDTNNGKVTLSGQVKDEAEAAKAISIAETVTGVKSVQSLLKTGDVAKGQDIDEPETGIGDQAEKIGDQAEKTGRDAGQLVGDAAITAKIKAKFAQDDVVQATNIDVDSNNGLVTLSGTVNSKQEEARAIQLAKTVDEVKTVRSDLVIGKDENKQ
jgi:hyperosmotically inducible protein